MRVAVIIPALNEERALPLVLDDLAAHLEAEIIVVDNGSTDKTPDVASSRGVVLVTEPARGYGAACLRGIRYLQERAEPPEVLVILDADYSDDSAVLPDFIARIRRGEADLVLSSRTQGGAEPGSMTEVQIWGNRLQTFALRHRFGLELTDMGPMRAISWQALMALKMQDRTWGWNIEMACKAARQKLRVQELPVSYRNRVGQSKISGSFQGAARAGAKILWALARYGI
ncbi:MAG: UDP-glucose--dolichyl-phosphate glucosyltransferase [Rickettsiales bacterium]|nr:UDP-glucose--dolichyl-phosphate glucosyltransferase [Rickettsiales bacterium]|tara:strand:+ start:5145 stop:5831 length:687 start_codon:yes stop_codon:yes gene_type:complete